MFAFKKIKRLVTKSDYSHVFEQAEKIVTSDFIILFRNNNLDCARLGLALSKKLIAKAHDRNRIKRLIREGFRQKELPAVDIIFLARQGVARHENANINAGLSRAWKKLISSCEK